MALKVYSIRLDEGLMARIDAHDQVRSDFIRDAITTALDRDDVALGGSMQKLHIAGPAKPTKIIKRGPGDGGLKPVPVKKKSDAVPPAVVRPGSEVVSPRAQDKADLLALIQSKRLSSRQAKDKLGWLGLRYENAERALMDDGAVWVNAGVLEVL